MATVTLETLDKELKAIRKELRKIKAHIEDPLGEKAKARSENNGFKKPLKVSPELHAFLKLGPDERISRADVTKKVNLYLEEHKLHDPLKRPRYHVAHISTKAALDLVRKAKKDGLQVTCEVTPHHFTLSDEDLFYADQKGNYIMKPPLSSVENRTALLEGLADGTIDAIATDHAPHASHEKECPADQAAFGIVGLETSLGLTISELVEKKVITISRAIELLSVNPRKILNLKPIRFTPGEEANFTIIDPDAEWIVSADSLKSKSANTPFLNRSLKGKATGIFHKGKLHARESLQ